MFGTHPSDVELFAAGVRHQFDVAPIPRYVALKSFCRRIYAVKYLVDSLNLATQTAANYKAFN